MKTQASCTGSSCGRPPSPEIGTYECALLGRRSVIWVRDGDHREVREPGEVPGIAGVKGETVGDGDGGDHGVVGTCRWFATWASPVIVEGF